MQKNKPHTIQTTFNYPITLYMHYIHRSKGFSVRRKSQTTGQRVEYSDEFAYMSYSITRRSSSINLLLVAGSTFILTKTTHQNTIIIFKFQVLKNCKKTTIYLPLSKV